MENLEEQRYLEDCKRRELESLACKNWDEDSDYPDDQDLRAAIAQDQQARERSGGGPDSWGCVESIYD